MAQGDVSGRLLPGGGSTCQRLPGLAEPVAADPSGAVVDDPPVGHPPATAGLGDVACRSGVVWVVEERKLFHVSRMTGGCDRNASEPSRNRPRLRRPIG